MLNYWLLSNSEDLITATPTRFVNIFMYVTCFSEIAKAQYSNSKPEPSYLDINSDKPIRLSAKIMVPAKEFPRVFIIIILS